jgi:hypothetical protein
MSASASLNRPAGSWTGYPDPSKTNLISDADVRGGSANFPAEGTEVATRVSNVSAAPSKNTKPRKKGNASGGAIEAATATHKANIAERLGAKCAPTVPMYKANAPEAGLTGRNVRILPSSMGSRDFYDRRDA